ncbi:S49 family peptidase [Bremerella cremea]|uniref:S49 family peptidase n=1 Tax=Bremerella cremea TaxID=1031537 RepID=UPI0031ED3D79
MSQPIERTALTQLAQSGPLLVSEQHLGRFLADASRRETATPKIPRVNGAVAVIPVEGMILYFDSWMGVNTNRLGNVIEAAIDNPRIKGVVLDVDSPGGTSYGTQELSDRIFAARNAKKPIVAISNPLMASAAMWIGSAASQVYATPSGDVGSLGTYQIHVDYSEMMKQAGIKVTFIHAGKNKVEWSPYHKLQQETIEHAQQEVDEVNDAFMSAVARNRGVKKSVVTGETWGQGRTLIASKAAQVGMIDGVISLNNLLIKMGADAPGTRDRHADADLSAYLQTIWDEEATVELVECQDQHQADADRARAALWRLSQ